MSQANKQAILKILRSNARLSVEQIAERLALPVDDVAACLRECEADNTILGYTAVIRDEAHTSNVRAMIEVSVEPERDSGFDRIAQDISRFPQVTDLLLVSGNYDLLLLVKGDTLQEVGDFVAAKLSPIQGVRSTRTHFMLKRYKESGFQLEHHEEFERLSVSP